MADPVAIYAAAVGTASLGWQIYREIRRRRTDLRVEFEHAAQPRAFIAGFLDDPDTRPDPLQYELTLVVVNDGETTEYVRDVAIENAARTAGWDFGDDAGDQELLPRSRVFAHARVEHIDLDLSGGFVGIARLASGRTIESKVEQLDDDLLGHIAEHNRTAKP